MRMCFRFFTFVFLSALSCAVHAVDYYWRSTTYQINGPSPAAVCEEVGPLYVSQGLGGSPYVYDSSSFAGLITATSGQCSVTYHHATNGTSYTNSSANSLKIYRYGDACPSGSTYNASTGECEGGDACASTAGVVKSHEHQTYPSINGDRVEPPGSICEGSCQYAFSYEPADDCYRFVDGSKDGGFCAYKYLGNGVSCTADNPQPGNVFDQPPTKPPTDKTPEYAQSNDCGEWTTNPDGTLSRSCTSTNTFNQPGTMDCQGGYPMGSACKPGDPAPAHTETSVSETTTKTNNPDGSTETNTTTTTDKTNCYGVKPCTSTSKTETSTSGTKPDGTPGDSSTDCTGSGCDNPEPDPEEDEPEERTATAGACDAAFSCSGDAIDCEILKKQKEQLCHAQEQADYEGKKADIEGLFQGEEFELKTDEVNAPSFINAGTRFLPSGGCPQPETMTFTSNGGSTKQFSYEPLCRIASDFSWLIVAFVSLWAAVYVGRAFGGE